MAKLPSHFAEDFDIWSLDTSLDRPSPYRRQFYQGNEFGEGDATRVRYNFPEDESTSNVNTNVQRIPARSPEDDDSNQIKVATTMASYAHLFSSHVLVHPFIVLRRQCQVSRKTTRYHLTPFTVIPAVYRLQDRHGLGSLWKGIGSALLVKGIVVLAEGALAETTPLVKDIVVTKLSMENVISHVSLKSLAIIIACPLFCSSLVETVQSSIAVESPGILDSVREALYRATHWKFCRSTRLLPIWVLFGPSVAYGLLHYAICSSVRSLVVWTQAPKPSTVPLLPGERLSNIDRVDFTEALADLIGNVVADIVLYPLETMLHRLCLQGTRTIIDNMDQPGIVTPIISDYDGLRDCYNTVLVEEGTSGLYKGFGALVLQYTFQFAFIKCTKLLIQQML